MIRAEAHRRHITDEQIGKSKRFLPENRSVASKRARILPERIRERLDALGLTPADAAKRAGLNRTFFYDLLEQKPDGEPKKASVNGSNLAKVAAVLDCAPGYITGAIDFIGTAPQSEGVEPPAGGGIPLLGAIDPGDTRRIPTSTDYAPLSPDPRFASLAHIAFVVETDAYRGLGIEQGQLAKAVDAQAYLARFGDLPTGMLAVVEITYPNKPGRRILTIRKIRSSHGTVWFEPLDREDAEYDTSLELGRKESRFGWRPLGIVVFAGRVFGQRDA